MSKIQLVFTFLGFHNQFSSFLLLILLPTKRICAENVTSLFFSNGCFLELAYGTQLIVPLTIAHVHGLPLVKTFWLFLATFFYAKHFEISFSSWQVFEFICCSSSPQHVFVAHFFKIENCPWSWATFFRNTSQFFSLWVFHTKRFAIFYFSSWLYRLFSRSFWLSGEFFLHWKLRLIIGYLPFGGNFSQKNSCEHRFPFKSCRIILFLLMAENRFFSETRLSLCFLTSSRKPCKICFLSSISDEF